MQKLLPTEVDEEEKEGVRDDCGNVDSKNSLRDNDQMTALMTMKKMWKM